MMNEFTAKKGKILLVEDEADVRSALIDVFASFDLMITDVSNGEQALTKLRSGEFYHVIVSDIKMPVMDGLELFESVRGLGIEYPFIFLTACNERDQVLEAMRLGAFDFIDKPFRPSELASVLELALDVGKRLEKIAEIKSQLAEHSLKSPAKAIMEIEHQMKTIQMMRVNNQRKRKAA